MVSPDTATGAIASTVEWVDIDRIFTDHTVNTRYVDDAWVDRRVAAFDPDKLGVPVVSERENGRFACLDGQNRLELCRRAGYGDSKIECRVFHNLTPAQEAALFLGHNDSRQVGTYHKFVARVTAEDPDAVAINNIVKAAGWELSYYLADKKIAAVAAVETIYKTGRLDPVDGRGATLKATLAIATEAWGHSQDAANGQVLRGIGLLVNRHHSILEIPALVKKLSTFRNGPLGILADARGLHQYTGGPIAACVAETLVRIYNSHRRTGALPPWRTDRGSD